MLKQTRVQLDLISDPDIYRMLRNSMRGRGCMITGRYTNAKNINLGTLFEPTKTKVYIINLDANNLYGKAMRFPMPESRFTWLTEEWCMIHWLTQREDQYTVYFVESDLEYPLELHDSHDYPLAPERIAVTPSVLREK